MQEIRSRRLFGYVQCDLKVPENLNAYFANFPPNFKNTIVSRNDIGDLMKEYAEREGITSQPRRMLISSFHLRNGTIITLLLLYYMHLGLEWTKKSSIRSVSSHELFQWLCIVCRQCSKAKRWNSQLKRSGWNIEVFSKQLLWVPDHGS